MIMKLIGGIFRRKPKTYQGKREIQKQPFGMKPIRTQAELMAELERRAAYDPRSKAKLEELRNEQKN